MAPRNNGGESLFLINCKTQTELALLDAGVDVNAKDWDGDIALMIAKHKGYIGIVDLPREAGRCILFITFAFYYLAPNICSKPPSALKFIM